jgi:dynein heavy chain 2
VVQFVSEVLGVKSLTGTSLNLPRLLKDETTPTIPVLLVTTPGADPSQELEEFAEKVVHSFFVGNFFNKRKLQTIGKANYRQVAMGQGQAELALSTLREGAKTGLWVTLKNLHLATSWLPILEKEILSLSQSGGVHENFRLWLTTEPHQRFSPILLHGSLKITYEAPPGIKKNLMV